ncbi:hypothetical protein DKX38_015850 [Salix brachista]|uniref:Uncharacterized protein n=1 Tax=Salix brachista TaxID=2182728 RepID=A0A5N5L6D5_9ROSI|nr:hypothetical protein DKX38_015850 [Salix brachista]
MKTNMDLMAIATALCACLSVLLATPAAAMQIHEKHSSHQIAGDDKIKLSVPAVLPRKLRVLLDDQEAAAVKSYEDQSSRAPLNKQKGDSAPAHSYQAKHTIRNKMGCMEADRPGHGVNGPSGPTSPIFLRWTIHWLEEDVQYITNPCRLVHKTWSRGLAAASIKLSVGFQ